MSSSWRRARRHLRRWRRRFSTQTGGRGSSAQIAKLQSEVAALRDSPGWDEQFDRWSFLFIVTYGRSGSTLLCGALNTIPGFLIRGENDQALYRLFSFHRDLVHRRAEFSKPGHVLPPEHPWYGIDEYNDEAVLRHFRQAVVNGLLRPGPDTRVMGFKEIRYDLEDLEDYLAFLRRLFPRVRFVFNSRDHAAVLRSQWWADRPDGPERLRRFQARLDAAERANADVSVHVSYDDYKDDVEGFRGLFDFLGEPFGVVELRNVLSRRHSY